MTSPRLVVRLLAAAFVGVALLSACGPLQYAVQSTPIATGADAEIVAAIDANQGVTRITIAAKNLPPPARVKDGDTNYVVWTRKDSDQAWSRLAALNYDEGARTADLAEVSVALTAFDLEITAESSIEVASPSAEVVFAQRVSK